MTPTNVTLAEHPVRRRPGQSRRRALWTGTTALALVAVLAACTGDTPAPPSASATATATSAPTASAAPTPSATPTPTSLPSASDDFSSIDLTVPPPRPDALDAPPSKEAAAEIAEYFLLLFSYAAATHDLTAFRELSYNDCGYCNRVLETLGEYEATGVTTEGGAIIVHETAVEEGRRGSFTVAVTFDQQASREVESTGSVLASDPGARGRVHKIQVLWSDSAWRVMAVLDA
ncbi:DUF6318 family protein [Cellulomonas sp. A375-1]|uniref:DUF6318 family protein n=1 Tax=Cellulomonas sp. A375-1 TaxID=1672219 RepID=UPI00069F21C8|nr:DUF6318 family protein [Cellulomonas sp. A375-1]